jgi:hypothetical protein
MNEFIRKYKAPAIVLEHDDKVKWLKKQIVNKNNTEDIRHINQIMDVTVSLVDRPSFENIVLLVSISSDYRFKSLIDIEYQGGSLW